MTEQSLRQSTKKGLLWSAAGNLANHGICFVFGIILARLLAPSDYGVIGILTVFISIIGVFIDCGFSQALIAKQDRTQKDFSTEFYFNIGVGLVGYAILFLISPFVASFYDMPILSPILKITGLGVIINSFCVVQSAQFAIKLDFKTPAKLSIVTQMLSGAVGIFLAYLGCGVWSLVFQQIAGSVLNAVLLWILAGWRPTREFSRDSFRYLWNYGSKILGSSLIQQIYDNMYPLIIGKFFSSKTLGLYSRAQGFAALPSTNLTGVLNSVTFPILCKINNDIPRLTDVYRRMIKTTAFAVFPMMLGLSALAEPLVKTLLNDQWYGCIKLLQILCCAMVFQPLCAINLSILKVVGRTDVILRLEIIKRIAGVTSIFASFPFGIVGMCYGYIILYIFCFCLNTVFTSRVMNTSFLKQIGDIIPSLINSSAMAILVYAFNAVIPVMELKLVLGISVGLLYYYLSARLLMKTTLSDAISLIKGKK